MAGTGGVRPSSLTIVAIDTTRAPGTVQWIAPHGIDLAIVSAPLAGAELRPACRIKDVTLMQVREQRQDDYVFQVLQSQLALGSGYSGPPIAASPRDSRSLRF